MADKTVIGFTDDNISKALKALKSVISGDERGRIILVAAKQAAAEARALTGVNSYPERDGANPPRPKIYDRQGAPTYRYKKNKTTGKSERGGIKTPGKPFQSAFKTQKQQAYFFAALHDGALKVPYTRTGLLGRSMTERVEVGAASIDIVLGTNVPYAPLVIGDSSEQLPYFASLGWKSLDTQVQAQSGAILAAFATGVNDGIRKALHP